MTQPTFAAEYDTRYSILMPPYTIPQTLHRSSTPVTASLSKKSIKVLLLILAVGFTYMAGAYVCVSECSYMACVFGYTYMCVSVRERERVIE